MLGALISVLLAACSGAGNGVVVGRINSPECPSGVSCAVPINFPATVTLTGPSRTYRVHTSPALHFPSTIFSESVAPGVYRLGGKYHGGTCSGSLVHVKVGERVVVTPRAVCSR